MLNSISSLHSSALPRAELHPGLSLNEHYKDVINNVMNSISTLAPEIIGMTVFGSLSRGEACVKSDSTVSDIDGVVVIDPSLDSELSNFTVINELKRVYPTIGVTTVGMATKVKIQDLIDSTAGGIFESDIDLLLASRVTLVDIPTKLLETTSEPAVKVSDWSSVDEDIKETLRYFISRDKTAGLFFPTIYGDLSRHRALALQPLAEHRRDMPQITSQVWKNIKFYTDQFCKRREDSDFAATTLPENLDEALQEFNVV